jgi:hypothetical protein
MPTTNFYFNNFQNSMEQRLVEDLIIESIKIYGIDVCYIPRTIIKEDFVFSEDVLSEFNDHYAIEMYIKNVDGFSGDGDFLSKFGLEIRDEMTLTVSQRRFHEEIGADNTTPVNETPGIDRPSEGDLIYFPLNGKIFQVKFVEHEAVFYQMGSLQTYDLTVELWEYSHEQLNTGMDAIDSVETMYSGDKEFYQILMEDGSVLLHEDGSAFVLESYRIEDTDAGANNEFFETQTRDPDLNFIDWSESNPFGDF